MKTVESQGGWKVGDLVKTFDGAYNTSTIVWFEQYAPGQPFEAVLIRPMVYANLGYVSAPHITWEQYSCPISKLRAAEVGQDGKPRNMSSGVYTYEDLKKVASGEWFASGKWK